MFVPDPARTVIEADESDVMEIHRSVEPVTVACGDRPPSPCQAFVCAIREGERARVHVALEQTDRRCVALYRSDRELVDGESHDVLVAEAIAFAESLGFAMQEVNLRYSKAMREVVIREVRVIRRPAAPPMTGVVDPAAKRPAAKRQEKEAKPAPEPPRAPSPPSPQPAEPMPKITPAVDTKALEAEARRMEAENTALEREGNARLEELNARIAELGREREEIRRALAGKEKSLEAEIAQLERRKAEDEQELAKRTAAHDAEVARLKADIDQLGAELARLGSGESTEVAELTAELSRLTAERERAESSAESAESELRDRLARLSAEWEEVRKASEERQETLARDIARMAREKEEAERLGSERVRELEQAVRRGEEEREAAGAVAARDIESLEESLRQQAREREAERKDAVARLAALVAEETVVAAERDAVRRLVLRTGEGGAEEALAAAGAETATLRAELERLASAKALAEQTAAARIAALQAEVERLGAAREPVRPVRRETAPRPAELPPQPVLPPSVSSDAGADRASTAPSESGWSAGVAATVDELLAGEENASDDFSFGDGADSGSSGGGAFRLDPSLSCVEYHDPADVIELHQPLNYVNVSPPGHVPQTCGAYICVLKRRETVRVYVAWSLTADRKTLVYVPEHPPSGEADSTGVVRDAFAFVETVGFMMDRLRLPDDPVKRGKALAAVPVLCRRG